VRQLPQSTPAESWFSAWEAHRWIKWPKPEHTYLVESLVVKGEPHLFIAEGGAGKTGLIADLALKVAAYPEFGGDLDWCGQRITNGGTAVLLLCEDSQTEMHRRILEIDQGGLIAKAGRRLVVIPLSAVSGRLSSLSSSECLTSALCAWTPSTRYPTGMRTTLWR
jgi:RecA-family ATPase